ncbi:MAG TPA: DUF1127 domain-containing protein [Burkholderiales bacterium]|jgi:uncharacterized protein YjiS (DUF1127 family)
MLRNLISWIGAVLRERRAYRELGQLDDRTLRDIGLSRDRLGGN